VWLIDADGSDLGFVDAGTAISLARQRGLDLVRLDQASSPPRYALMDAAAAEAALAREQRMARGEIKEIRLRVATGVADLETRRKNAEELLAKGYRVKLRVELDPARKSDPAPARAVLDSLVKAMKAIGRPVSKPQSEKGAVAVTLEPI
jgi:translation initiation factor IF-3